MKNESSCSRCSIVWRKKGKTNSWRGDPESKPPKPGYCPSESHMDVIQEGVEKAGLSTRVPEGGKLKWSHVVEGLQLVVPILTKLYQC